MEGMINGQVMKLLKGGKVLKQNFYNFETVTPESINFEKSYSSIDFLKDMDPKKMPFTFSIHTKTPKPSVGDIVFSGLVSCTKIEGNSFTFSGIGPIKRTIIKYVKKFITLKLYLKKHKITLNNK